MRKDSNQTNDEFSGRSKSVGESAITEVAEYCPECGSDWEIEHRKNGWVVADCPTCGKGRVNAPDAKR
jgi:predicted RNA-binding Zn-ribbon protein involved in translation (DUF1610 family)